MPSIEAGGQRLRRHPYILCLPHSDGYPTIMNSPRQAQEQALIIVECKAFKMGR